MNNKIHFKNLFIKKYKWLLITLLFIFNNTALFSQDLNIALEYFKLKEYSKAKPIFEKLLKSKQPEPEIHNYYFKTLVALNELKDLEKYLKKQIRSQKNKARYLVDLGELYLNQEKTEEGKSEFEKAIVSVKENEFEAKQLASYFVEIGKVDLAITTLLLTRETSGNELLFGNTLGRLFKLKGNTAMMIHEYLSFAESEGNLDYFKTIIQDEIKTEKDLAILEKVLYEKVQKYPDKPFFTEVLVSHLVNQKLFYKAFLQARALDKRMKYEGSNVYELAFVARQNKDFINAAKMFEYMAKEYPKNPEYPSVKRLYISCKEEAIKNVYPIDNKEIISLIAEYDRLINELGTNQRTVEAMKSKALLYAFYLDEKEKAIEILQTAIKLGAADRNFVSRCKLDLGDIQILNSEYWEATLTYQQVEKAENDNPVGYEAKLKNAKLNYFKGDFELAEDILNILKKATTREIANDAMALSLLIKDNIGADSTETAMKIYAATDLLMFQNKIDAAIDSLTFLIYKFEKHSLADEAYFLRANCYLKLNNVEKAVSDLKKITENFPDDVLGDDAAYLLATIIEEKLLDKATAMNLYQEILKKYPGSIYVVDSRNRFRALRGDVIN